MSRPNIDVEVILWLRDLVIGHNEAGVGAKTRLEELKQVYRQGWIGRQPHLAAKARVERHLRRLAKAALEEPSASALHVTRETLP